MIIALLLMRLKPQSVQIRTASALADLREGLCYAASHRTIRAIIVMAAATTVFSMSFTTLLPARAVNILGRNASADGFVQSARGVGSLIGAPTIASVGRFQFKRKVLTFGSFTYPSC